MARGAEGSADAVVSRVFVRAPGIDENNDVITGAAAAGGT